jgi:transposase-like protein
LTNGYVIADQAAWEEQIQFFSTDQACEEALAAAKWPEGFRCTRCGHAHAYKIATRRLPLFECSSCHYQESIIAGTIMEGSKSALRKWFHAMLLVSHCSSGINAVQLANEIEVTYKTAWLILHKLRYAMSQEDACTKLSGLVRINSALYGRPHNPTVERHVKEQPLLIGASLDEEGEPLYIKIKKVIEKHSIGRSVRSEGSQAFIEEHVAPETEDIEAVTARYSPRRFHRLLDTVRKAGRWINSIFHGIGPKHLQSYLNEYCYRLNLSVRKLSAFCCLLHTCASTATINYQYLIRFPV